MDGIPLLLNFIEFHDFANLEVLKNFNKLI